MATFIFAFLLQCFFPIFETSVSEFLGMSIVNTDAQTREYVVTARNSEGSVSREGRINLAPGNQTAF